MLLLALLAIAPSRLAAQTIWEIRSASEWPILDVTLDSIDGDILAYNGAGRLHLDSITSLVPHEAKRGNPGGAALGLLIGAVVSGGIAIANFNLEGNVDDATRLLITAPLVVGPIAGFLTKRDAAGQPVVLLGLTTPQRRTTVAHLLLDAELPATPP